MKTDTIIERIKRYYDLVDSSRNVEYITPHVKFGTYVEPSKKKYAFTYDEQAVQQIGDLFAEKGVYERQGWPPCIGKTAILDFFGKRRTLLGRHEIDQAASVQVQEKIDPKILKLLKKQFPDVDTKDCKMIAVGGKFNGVQSSADEKGLTYAGNIELPFKDYWVISTSQDCVIYRYSQIKREKGLSV
jgi:hypothetical protein